MSSASIPSFAGILLYPLSDNTVQNNSHVSALSSTTRILNIGMPPLTVFFILYHKSSTNKRQIYSMLVTINHNIQRTRQDKLVQSFF